MRSSPRLAASKRAEQQSERTGTAIAMARADLGLDRKAVARRAGVSPDTERRVEAGDPSVQLDTLCSVGSAVNLDVVVQTYPARPPSLRDSGQLAVAQVLCDLASDRWTPRLELRAGDHGEAADTVFFGSAEILDVEIERLLLDFQAQYRRDARKRDVIAGAHSRPVRLILVVEDTPRNRAAVAQHRALIDTLLPATSREVLRSLRTGEPLGRDGLLWIRRRRPPARAARG